MKTIYRSLAGGCALLLAAQIQAADGHTIYQKGGANPAAMACATCHGPDGLGMAAGLPAAGRALQRLRRQTAG